MNKIDLVDQFDTGKEGNRDEVSSSKNISTEGMGKPSAKPPVRSEQKWLFLALILSVMAVFYFTTFRGGQEWGDDFAMYIRHSINIVKGVSYGDTGFIMRPNRVIGPQTYPPVFPLMLAPIYYFWGLNLTAMKVLIAISIILTVAFVFHAFKDYLPAGYRLVLVAMIGFNPLIWSFKDSIISDIPFAFFTYLSLCITHTSYGKKQSRSMDILYAVMIAATIYLSYGTRSVGLVLIPGLIAYDLIKNKRPSLKCILAVILSATAIYIQNKTSHADEGYGPQLSISTQHVLTHSWIYFKLLSVYLENGYSKIIKLMIYSPIIALALIGYFHRLRREITCYEIFPVLYIGPFLMLPIMPVERYLIVLVPLFFCYVLIGVKLLTAGRNIEKYALSVLMIAVLGSYAAMYTTMNFGPYQEGIALPESEQLFYYIRNNTRPDDVVIFRKPRAMALYTDRRSATWDPGVSDENQWEFFEKINATYLVLGPQVADPDDYHYLEGFISRFPDRLKKDFSNRDFAVFRITPAETGDNAHAGGIK